MMKATIIRQLLVWTLLSASGMTGAAESCGPEAICGLKNPEDLMRLDGSRFAIASRLAHDSKAAGGLSLIDLDRKTVTVLSADVSKPPSATYSKCPGPPAVADLITHGLDVRRTNDSYQVFTVNHGGRESVEVFDLKMGRQPKLTWAGCVLVPAEFSSNAVAALPDGLAVSSFGTAGKEGTAELLAGKPQGFVGLWTPAKGWIHVAGSEFGGDNGVTATRDGSVLYINDWSDGTLRIAPLRPDKPPATIQLGSFHPDNVHSLSDGNLLIAGQVGTASDVLACVAQPACPVASMIVVVDPRRQLVKSRWTVESSATFGAASTALLYRGRYWLSSFRGDRIIQVNLKAAH